MKKRGSIFRKNKLHKTFARVISCVMVAAMLFLNTNLTAFAAEVDPYAVQTLAVSGGYETLTIDSGTLNGSTIYGSGDSEFALDEDGGFYSSAWKTTGCLPDSGYITVESVPYQFTWTGSKPYAGMDSIRLSAASPVNTTSKTMVLKQYGVYDKIYVLGTAAGFANENLTLSFSVDLYYTDGTSSNTTYLLGDWYRDGAADTNITLYTGLYRKDVKAGNGEYGYIKNEHGPRLQSMAIECNENKLLKEIKFTMNTTTDTSNGVRYLYSGIYAVTGKVSDNAPATPNLHEMTDAYKTSTSFTANWDAASNNPTKYYLDVAEDASFAKMVSGYSNKDVGNVTEFKVEGLTQGQTYYYRVRSANNAGQSLSSEVRTAIPDFKKLPSPELSYENTVAVGEQTLLQAVSWSKSENVNNYRWSVDVGNDNGTVSTYTGDLSQTASEDSAYVVTDGTKYWLDITNLVDNVGTYAVSVVADPVANSDEYLSSDAAVKNVNIVYPEVTVDVTDELKASGIVSGIGGDCEKTVTNGVLTLTAKNANAYSELGTWYKSGEVFDAGVSTSLTADTQYVDTYKLIFDINRTKLDLVADENGKYTLKLNENIILEEDLVFTEDITLDLNGKNIIADTNAGFEVDDAILNIKNGKVVDATVGTDTIISTIDNGAVIIESNVALTGIVGGDAEVKWTESDGSTHYATMKDAVTEGGTKEAADNSVLTLMKDKALTESTTVPENISVYVPEGVNLSVAEDVVLTNNGSLITDGTISNAGTIENTETANWQNEGYVANTATGKINNAGSVNNNAGQIDNAGEIKGSGAIANENGVITTTEGRLQNNIDNGTTGKILSEVSWDDENGTWFGPIEDAVEYAEDVAGAGKNVTIDVQGTIVLDGTVTIPENATLNIPANKVVMVPEGVVLDNNGEIVESGTLQVNGTLYSESKWTDGGNNHYGTLDNALNKAETGEEITLLEDKQWTGAGALSVPDGVTLVVPNDVVLEVENGNVANPENIKSETSWKEDVSSSALNFGSLKDAVEDAATSNSKVDILLRDEVVVEEDLVIPNNTRVEVPNGTSMTIPDEVVVQNNGGIVVDEEGELDIDGTLKTGAAWTEEATDGTKKDYYGTLDKVLDALESEETKVPNITIMDDVVLEENATIPEGTNLTIGNGASLTIPSGKELENNGNITNKGTLNNNGTVSNNKEIVNNGLVDGDGSIANTDNSRIDTNDGVLKNTITDEEGNPDASKVESEAILTDPVTREKYYGGLSSLLENANAGDEIVLNKDQIVLEEDIVIPDGVTLTIPGDANLVVPEGKTLVNNGVIENNSGYGLVIKEGTAVNNGTIGGNGTITNNGGFVDLTEGVTSNEVNSLQGGVVKSEATWTIDGKTYRGSLKEALEAVDNNGGGTVTIDTPELNIEDDITIPDGVELVVPEDTKLTVPDGVTVTNDGSIVSNGEIKTEGTGKINSDASWTDKEGKVTYGNINEAVEAMRPDENGVPGVTDITILGDDVTLPEGNEEVIIPEGVELEITDGANLVIPEGTELVNKGEMLVNGELSGAGSIDNSAGSIEMCNGAIKSEIEAGKEGDLKDVVLVESEEGNYYTSIEEALKDEDAEIITALGNVKLKEDIIILEDVTLVIPDGASVTVTDGKAMVNNGIIAGDGKIVNNGGLVDLTEGITSSEVESQDGIVKSEAVWEKDGEIYRGSLEKILDKVASNGGGTITIDTPELDIEESITIPDGVELVVPEETVVNIKDGAIIENNGNIVSNGSINTEGTGKIKTDASWIDKDGKVTYGSIEEALEAMRPDENGVSDVTDITILGDNVTLPEGNEEIIIPEGVELEIADGAELIIPEDTELVNKGELHVNGEVSGAGTIDNSTGSIEMGNGAIKSEFAEGKEGSLKDLVLVEKEDGSSCYTSMEKALRDSDVEKITVISNTELKEDVVIPEDVTVVIPEDVSLIVPEGITLENNGEIENNGDHGLVVKEGTAVNNGTIAGNGTIVNNGGLVDLTEGVTTNTVDNMPNSTVKSEATWTIDGKTYRGSLEEALEAVANNGGGTVTIDTPELNIEETITIPDGVDLVVPKNTVVNIKDGANLVISDGAELVNKGELHVNGEVSGAGTIDNSAGSIEMGNGAIKSEFAEGKEGSLKDVVFVETEDGNSYYTSIEEALRDPEVEKITAVSDIKLNEDITIPENVTLVIPDGISVTVKEGVTLTNTGTIVNNGIISAGENFVNEGNVTGNGKVVDESKSNNNDSNDSNDSNDNKDTEIDFIISTTQPQQPEKEVSDTDSDTEKVVEEESVIKVVEEESVIEEDKDVLNGSDEQEQKEAIIAERDKAKKDAQIVAKEVVFEAVESDRVSEDLNVKYGEGKISIVIDTLDKAGKIDTQMYNSVILSELSIVVDACLTPEEKLAVEAGSSVEIRLTIQAMPGEVSHEDIIIVEETVSKMKEELPGLEIAGHLDICVEKNFDGKNWNRIPKLNEEIEIQFEIPEDMRVENAKYSVLRLHDGETTLLEDLDDDENTITIRTELFSVYSVLYEKEEDSHNLWWLILLILILIILVVWIQRERNKRRGYIK